MVCIGGIRVIEDGGHWQDSLHLAGLSGEASSASQVLALACYPLRVSTFITFPHPLGPKDFPVIPSNSLNIDLKLQ